MSPDAALAVIVSAIAISTFTMGFFCGSIRTSNAVKKMLANVLETLKGTTP